MAAWIASHLSHQSNSSTLTGAQPFCWEMAEFEWHFSISRPPPVLSLSSSRDILQSRTDQTQKPQKTPRWKGYSHKAALGDTGVQPQLVRVTGGIEPKLSWVWLRALQQYQSCIDSPLREHRFVYWLQFCNTKKERKKLAVRERWLLIFTCIFCWQLLF